MTITGGEAICKMLHEEGVKYVFGIIDGTYFGLYANLEKYGIELVTPRHETSAAHMAGAYARLTGKLGVCIASNGPGVANILPGVAVENTEGNRVMLITSCRRNPIIHPDRGGGYQAFDQTGVIGNMSKYSQMVPSQERLPEIMRHALRQSFNGRPGVVHVDVPENLINGKYQFNHSHFWPVNRYRRTEPQQPNADQVQQAAQMLVNAKFPVVHAGSGVIHAQAFDELEELANLLYAPVTTSWGGRGALCESNELSIPLVHVELNNKLRNDSDVILTLGSRIGETDWWGKMPNWADPASQKMIQVDIDDELFGRNKPLDIAIKADIQAFLKSLNKELKSKFSRIPKDNRKKQFKKYLDIQQKDRQKWDKNLEEMAAPMNTAHVPAACKKVFQNNAVAVFDGGNTAVWGQFFYKCIRPGFGISTPKMGMLGAGVSQALGAAVACPDQYVYCIIGDGAMGFHPQEIETAIRNELKVVYLVVCDKQWGMVKMNQQFSLKPVKTFIKKSLSDEETIHANLGEVEWHKLAESMGAYGERVADPNELPKAIERCVASQKCAVIHVDVDPVRHMWAPSLIQFKKMHEEPKGK